MKMKCSDIKQWMIDFSQSGLTQEEMALVEQHILHCPDCASFKKDLGKIRTAVKMLPLPEPPEPLLERTGNMIRAAWGQERSSDAGLTGRMRPVSIPAYIWAALIALVILTAALVLPVLTDFTFDQTLSFETVIVLTLIILNTVMLFFSPLLIRRFGFKGKGLNPVFDDLNPERTFQSHRP